MTAENPTPPWPTHVETLTAENPTHPNPLALHCPPMLTLTAENPTPSPPTTLSTHTETDSWKTHPTPTHCTVHPCWDSLSIGRGWVIFRQDFNVVLIAGWMHCVVHTWPVHRHMLQVILMHLHTQHIAWITRKVITIFTNHREKL